jgi:peptidoglycan/LPS O-acetylase OafA/YrhL
MDCVRSRSWVSLSGTILGIPFGWAGVDIFFVLSGFLITGILYDTRDDVHRVRNFYIRRTLRIFPLYYGVFIAILLTTPWMHWAWTWQWLAWPLYLGNFLRFLYPHLHNDFVMAFADAHLMSKVSPGSELDLGHFWSLCVEEQFYLVWPWIVFAVRDRRKLMAICTACIVAVPIARTVAMAHLPQALVDGEVVLHATPFRFDTLMVGALIALLYRGAHRDLMQRTARMILLAGVLWLLWFEASLYMFGSSKYLDVVQRRPWLLSVVAVFAGALLLRTLIPGTVAYRIFRLRWLRWLGTVSYGAYVFHDIPHRLYLTFLTARAPLHAHKLAALAGLGTTLLLSFVSYRFFESPILRLKDRLTSDRP